VKNINTHAHGDVHLLVLARLRRRWSLSGRDGVGTSLPWKCSSLKKPTERWPRGHLRVRSVQAEARAKGLSERTLAVVHHHVWCTFGVHRTQATGRSASASGQGDVSAARRRAVVRCTDRTRPVEDFARWTLTGNDQMPR
jgi:hypothetical protein